MEVTMNHKLRIIAICAVTLIALPATAMRRQGRGQPARAGRGRGDAQFQADLARAMQLSLAEHGAPQVGNAGDGAADADIPAELLAESLRLAEENARRMAEEERQAQLRRQQQQQEKEPRIPVPPAPGGEDAPAEAPHAAHDHIVALLVERAARLEEVRARALKPADNAEVRKAQQELAALQHQLQQKQDLNDDDCKQLEALHQKVARADWHVNTEFGCHRHLADLGLPAVQLRSVEQGANECGLYTLVNAGAVASALQGPNGIEIKNVNSEVIASLVEPAVQKFQGEFEKAFQGFDGPGLKNGKAKDIAELGIVLHALHTPDYLPIFRGIATIVLENQGALGFLPSYVMECGAFGGPVTVQDAFAAQQHGPHMDIQGPIGRSLESSGIVNFVVNNGGHWVTASVIAPPEQEPLLVHLNSTNAPGDAEGTSTKHALQYICQLSLPKLQALGRMQ